MFLSAWLLAYEQEQDAFWYEWEEMRPGTGHPNPGKLGGKVGQFRDRDLDEAEEFARETRAMMEAGDFDGLEERVATILVERQQFGNGQWKLSAYYRSLSYCPPSQPDQCQKLKERLENWREARPGSLSAHIALACFHIHHAGEAPSIASTQKSNPGTTLESRERLQEAAGILNRARSLGICDPHFWRAYQSVALGLGMASSEHDEIFEQGIAIDPGYTELYIGYGCHLLKAWGGHPGQLATFAANATSIPGAHGDEIYALLAMEFEKCYDRFFAESRFEWPRVRGGMEALRKRYPGSVDLLSRCAMISAAARDATEARKYFAELGNRLDQRTWLTQQRYHHYLNYGR